MKRMRDRLIAIGAFLILVALAATIVALVLNAQESGVSTREELRLDQSRALANSMESRFQSAYASISGAHGPGVFTFEPGNQADTKLITPADPEARTGSVLVTKDHVIVNGSLLRDPSVVGTTYDRPGLDDVLAGKPTTLVAGPGLTTTRPTFALGFPGLDPAGKIIGAYILELEIAPDSTFNLEIAQLTAGKTGRFSYVDASGTVVASSNEALLGKKLHASAVGSFTSGFHRKAGQVAAIAEVPSAGWRLVFLQETGEFQGDLTGPLQAALLLFLGVVGVVGVVSVVALLRRLQAAREEQRRLQEIGEAREEFTSIVSHELRTPVAGLLGFLQTTVDHWDAMADAERRRAVGRAFTNARALQTLTSDVLDSASIEARTLTYRFESVDLRASVAEAVQTLHDAAPDRQVTITKPSQDVTVRADALRLCQVLANLLDNAAKSSPPDSPIDVDISVGGRVATVSVRDRGPGISPEDRERVFEKFTRGRTGVGRGTGLGLYISRHIVEAHGGTIDVVSVPGEAGARLTFTLPLAT